MRKKLPTISWLCAFEAASRHSSMTRAAEELSISHSAVSQQIKSLEQYLGTRLFRRTPKGIALTESGRYYIPLVSEAISLLDRGTMTFLASNRRAKLNIAANFSFALLWLIPKLKEFTAIHRDVDISISSMLWPHEFDNSDAPIRFRYGRGNWSDGSYHQLTEDRIFPVCAPRLAPAVRSVEQLLANVLIEVTGTASGWETWLAAIGWTKPYVPAGEIQVNNFAASIELAKRGHGIALAHETIAHEALANGSLVIPLSSDVVAKEQYYVSVGVNECRKKVVSDFVSWLQEELRPTGRSSDTSLV